MQMMFNFGKKKQAPAAPSKGGKSAPKGKSAPVKQSMSSGFAGGLVGSDVEAPEFDPLQLSVGRSEETLAWYRAAELKVRSNIFVSFKSPYFLTIPTLIACTHLHVSSSWSICAACFPSP
jgi:hypothetical protein